MRIPRLFILVSQEAFLRSLVRKILSEGNLTENQYFNVPEHKVKDEIPPNKKIVYPDINNWSVKRIRESNWSPTQSTNEAIHIYDNNDVKVGTIYYMGKERGYGVSYNWNKVDKNYERAEVKDFSKMAVKQAVRWVFLSTQKPIKKPLTKPLKTSAGQTSATELEESTLGGYNERTIDYDDMNDFRNFESPDVKGWVAHITLKTGRHFSGQIYSQAVYIYNDKGIYVGSITYSGGYRLVGSYDEHERGKFNPEDDNSIRQAIRFMFLMTQKPINKRMT